MLPIAPSLICQARGLCRCDSNSHYKHFVQHSRHGLKQLSWSFLTIIFDSVTHRLPSIWCCQAQCNLIVLNPVVTFRKLFEDVSPCQLPSSELGSFQHIGLVPHSLPALQENASQQRHLLQAAHAAGLSDKITVADAQQVLDCDDPAACLADMTAAPAPAADVFLSEPFYAALESCPPWSQLRCALSALNGHRPTQFSSQA